MNPRPAIPVSVTAPESEVVYDRASEARIDNPERGESEPPAVGQARSLGGPGCHGGKAEMSRAAEAAGNGGLMQRLRTDYPQGPHDQPQSMCPAFGSLRVGLRLGWCVIFI